MFSIILITIILISLSFVGVIVFRKFPLLAHINLEKLQAEKQAEVKSALLEKRFKRDFKFVAKFFKSLVWIKICDWSNKFYKSVILLETKYKEERKLKKTIKLSLKEKQEKINQKFVQANELTQEEKYSQAEKIYLEIISIDPNNEEAYLGLAKIYSKQKDFEHAKELYDHILKKDKKSSHAFSGLGNLAAETGNWARAKSNYQKSIELSNKKNAEHFLDLATAEYNLGNPGRALTAVRKASEIEPNNPKYLDFLIDAAIINKNKILALDAFNKLKTINSDNQKLAEFKKRIQEM
ncbi:tetratricopeptide repeat protein [Patescibacteria group bacterium]|nr:tetratricopeptide repeat protein [Patescibacteria group bacterium]